MTRNTNSDNIKSMFWCIAGMMIVFCLFTTRALQSIDWRNFAISDGVVYSIFGFMLCWMANAIFLYVAFLVCFATFCLAMFLTIFQTANLAIVLVAVICTTVFVKFRKWFDLLASRTIFCYNRFSHFCFSSKRDWLEPVAAHTAVGSSYYTTNRNKDKLFFRFLLWAGGPQRCGFPQSRISYSRQVGGHRFFDKLIWAWRLN